MSKSKQYNLGLWRPFRHSWQVKRCVQNTIYHFDPLYVSDVKNQVPAICLALPNRTYGYLVTVNRWESISSGIIRPCGRVFLHTVSAQSRYFHSPVNPIHSFHSCCWAVKLTSLSESLTTYQYQWIPLWFAPIPAVYRGYVFTCTSN